MTRELWIRASLYAAALAAGTTFSVVFTGNPYGGSADDLSGLLGSTQSAFAVMAGAAIVAILVGSAGRYRFILLLPAAALYTLVAVYGRLPLSISGWRRLAAEIWRDVFTAANIMYLQRVPYDLQSGLFVLLIPVVVILVAFATSATLYERSPVISVTILGLTVGVLSTISFEDGIGPYFAVFLVSAVALLYATGTVGSTGSLRSLSRSGVVAGVAVVLIVLLLPKMPLASSMIRPGAIDWTRIGAGQTSRLSTQADVGDYLSAGRDAQIFEVQSSEPLYWRGGTLDHFDGVRWTSTTSPGESDGEEISPKVPTRTVYQRVKVLDSETNLVFGGYEIVNTSLPDAQRHSDGSWSVANTLGDGTEYRVISKVPEPTAEQLQNAGTSYSKTIRQKYLQLPGNRPEVLQKTAERIQRRYRPVTPYEKARAIQRYLLYDGGFVYNLNVKYPPGQELQEFLGDKREGFCTQFATSMALLAREMGVPSRIVYGATEGQQARPNEYMVTGYDMHTWVEIYFPGVGWYPFDPTPGFSVPNAMEANAPMPQNPAIGQDAAVNSPNLYEKRPLGHGVAPSIQSSSEKKQHATSPEKHKSRSKQQRPSTVPPWIPYTLLLVILVASVPLTKGLLLRKGDPDALYEDLTGRLRDILPPGKARLADSPALTPMERILLLADAAGLESGPFKEFSRAYSGYLYSGEAGPETYRTVQIAYRRARRAYAILPLWRRALGVVNPASLLWRAKAGLKSLRAYSRKTIQGRLRSIIRRLR